MMRDGVDSLKTLLGVAWGSWRVLGVSCLDLYVYTFGYLERPFESARGGVPRVLVVLCGLR